MRERDPNRMRLAEFILADMEAILTEWEGFARGLAPGKEMSVLALRDHAEDILRVTARDMLTEQSSLQQSDKSKGFGGGGTESEHLDRASEEHAMHRLGSGFNLIEVVSEYRALRASVLRLWLGSIRDPDERDLQDLIRFNESIDQSLAEAVKRFTNGLDESRELFLATLGHDLRTPLNAIMLSSQVLTRSEQLDEENRQIASHMVGFGNVMTGMINDLLDFTRTRLGAGMPVSVARHDLAELCGQVLEEFRAGYPDRLLLCESSGDTSGEWDAARLRQVLSNLVANAIQHGESDSPVEVSVRAEGADVLLTVTNRGPAIPPSALRTLFDPFVRGVAPPATPRRALGGVGLGLYIAREIVIAHGGTIGVTSSDPIGTVFSVRLPRTYATEQQRAWAE